MLEWPNECLGESLAVEVSEAAYAELGVKWGEDSSDWCCKYLCIVYGGMFELPFMLLMWLTDIEADESRRHASDLVQKYTGIRIAFFFHFYDVFTRQVQTPSVGGGPKVIQTGRFA